MSDIDDFFDDEDEDGNSGDELLQELLSVNDPRELTAELRELVAPLYEGREPLQIALIEEALSLAETGDVSGAHHRLRLWVEPKWSSESECQDAYRKVMAEQEARRVAGEV